MLIDRAIVGDSCAGTRATMLGEISNFSYTGAYGGAECSWVYTAPNSDSHELVVYVDGDLLARLLSTETSAAITNMTDGVHTVQVLPQHIGSVYGHRHGADLGQRAYITWPRQAGVSAYNVYRNSVLVEALETVTFDETVNKPSDMDGGRITITGRCNAAVAADVIISIEGTTLAVAWPDETITVDIVPGGEVSIGNGLWVIAQDDVEDYPNGGLWTIGVGPQNEHVSSELAPGTYVYAVTALDAAGNESSALSGVTVVIDAVPDPVGSQQIAWDADAGAVVVTWDEHADADSILIYTNINPNLGDQALSDAAIDMDAPFETLAGDATEWSWGNAASAAGLLSAYVLPVKSGIMATDRQVLSINLPVTFVDLGIVLSMPTNITATPTPNGGLIIGWDYYITADDDCTGFFTSWDCGAHTATVLRSAGSGVPAASYVLDRSGTDYSHGSTKTFDVTVTPYNTASGVTTSGTAATVSVTVDSVAPTVSGSVMGYAQ